MKYFMCGFLWSVLLSVQCTAEAGETYAEVGAGYAFSTPWGEVFNDNTAAWKGSNPTAYIAVGHQFDNGVAVEYQHISNWFTGFPFNDDEETGIDQVVIKYRFTFGR